MIWPFGRRRKFTDLLVRQHNEYVQLVKILDEQIVALRTQLQCQQEHVDWVQRSMNAVSQQVAHGNIAICTANTVSQAAYDIALAAQRYCVSVHEKAPEDEQGECLQVLEGVLKRYETGVRLQ